METIVSSDGALPVSRLKLSDLVASRAERFLFGAMALMVSRFLRKTYTLVVVGGLPPLQN